MNLQFPMPDAQAQAHSEALRQHLCGVIRQAGGRITFKAFMDLALYAPGLGYYSAGSHKLGAAGDFITAPEVSPLFGATLARAIATVRAELAQADLLEIGAGSGALAVSILQALQQQGDTMTHYYILEVSADLRERQRQRLEQAGLLERVCWLDALPEYFVGVVLANEVLDAMPVHVVEITASGVQERYVALQDDRQFIWQTGALSDARLLQRVTDIQQRTGQRLPIGYVSEINLAAEDWLAALAAACQQAAVLLIDYGFPRHEYYHPQRNQGTLMCHYRHYSHADPFQFVGLQDITAHVDFTAMADAAVASGWTVAGYTTQAHFLLGSGLMELLDEPAGALSAAALLQQQAVKKLTLPHEMGELFKVLGLQKNLSLDLPGFCLRDLRDHL
ncbi:MAG: SAM-dependent methyltransferase [Gammaproteobacteria bacterium]